jgi:hypothetical protein
MPRLIRRGGALRPKANKWNQLRSVHLLGLDEIQNQDGELAKRKHNSIMMTALGAGDGRMMLNKF